MQIDYVSFSASCFAIEPGEDEDINPGVYGKTLSLWIGERLRSRGYQADMVDEDFARLVMAQRKPFRLWVGCASHEGSTTRWQLMLVAEWVWLARWFRGVDPAPRIERFRRDMVEIVREIPGVSEIQWEGKTRQGG